MEKSRFRKIVDQIKQRPILLLMFIFPPVTLNNSEDWDYWGNWYKWDDTDDLWFGVSAIFYVFLDALFLYVPLIDEETKCVMLDNRLKIAAIVLRSFGDLRYLCRIFYCIRDGRRVYNILERNGIQNDQQYSHIFKKIAMNVANDAVCILPVPQVVILIFLPKMRGLSSLKIMKFLNSLILLQYLLRLYPIFEMCMQFNKDMLDLFKKKTKDDAPNDKKLPVKNIPKWFGIAINIVGYILASHVLGAFWYFFSIQREIDCWGYACRIENGCEFSTSCVENTFRNITHIKNLCPINPPNATVFDFGIFIYALQSGMQGSTNFPEKFLQCFSWGLRNLSSFASNLNSSTYGWENLFVVVISISGLVLFMYLLGHSQTYMQESDRRDSVKRKMKMIIEPKIQSLVSDYDFLSDGKWAIKRAVKLILEKDEDFILKNMFSILSFNFPDERQQMKERLDFIIKTDLFLGKDRKVKKVEGLKDKDPEVLKKICEHLEPRIYMAGSYIIREGEPLDMMFFVTQGIVLTYATDNGGSSSSGTIQLIKKERDSLYGEELLPFAEGPSGELSTLPISRITVKSHNKVEVFALKAVDLLKVFSEVSKKDVKDMVEIASAHA